MEAPKRSIAKTITFRILATITTVILIYIFTKSLKLAGAMGLVDIFIKLLLYYFHERVWNKIHWGRRKLKIK